MNLMLTSSLQIIGLNEVVVDWPKVESCHSQEIREQRRTVFYFVNDGVQSSFGLLWGNHSIPDPCILISQSEKGENEDCYLFGQSVDAFDLIGQKCLPRLDIGDWLMFEQFGAYSLSLSKSSDQNIIRAFII